MSNLTKQQLQYVADLARIEVAQTELDSLTTEVSNILGFVDYIQSADTNKLKPISQVTNLQDVWRDDQVVSCKIPSSELLANAPATKDGYIKVKKVL